MTEPRRAIRYLIFDVEAVADGSLISKVRYPGEGLSPADATRRFRDEVLAERGDGKDILPVTYMLPISVAIAKVDAQFRLVDQVVLDSPQFRPHVIVRHFWSGWEKYGHPTFVTFNGRGYDIPVMELAAFRFGYSVPNWFNVYGKAYEQSRNRYNFESHLDLCDLINNFGAYRLSGGLNLLANLIGKPGKTGIDGSQVQDYHDSGRAAEVNDYCRCDVLDTYFVFLRCQVMLGKLTIQQEHALVEEARAFLQSRSSEIPAYARYLEHWGEWSPPAD
jgi:predicted PolB exonuclease-like 3'-5' exonuclease